MILLEAGAIETVERTYLATSPPSSLLHARVPAYSHRDRNLESHRCIWDRIRPLECSDTAGGRVAVESLESDVALLESTYGHPRFCDMPDPPIISEDHRPFAYLGREGHQIFSFDVGGPLGYMNVCASQNHLDLHCFPLTQ